ncbi:hypothetical protein WICPIJ_001103 [Wickerhamomyces pijperi]|uniref:Delta(14)-sterol reductase n=1 Tax=Wickerhamomyces pijperi TaxID=599730 RepID=A0A9P8TQX2_WICPI|nr:hypothetical protein WICPIJ_001103 [Wickerhamomyces pijperi]
MSKLNPVTKHMEFGGITGVLSITFGLPLLLIAFHQLINDDYQTTLFTNFDLEKILTFKKPLLDICLDAQIWTYYLLWFCGLAVLDVILPGYYKEGVELRDGSKLTYLINGISISSFLLIVLASRFVTTEGALPELQFLYSHILEFTVISILFSFAFSTFIYLFSFIKLRTPNKLSNDERNEKILAAGGNTGNVIYDWFIGRELNPRFGPLDVKLFCELRPGMLLWLLLNLSCMHHQWLTLGRVTDSMILLNVMQSIYIFDGVLNEDGVLTMMDVTTDGFGYMLCFGDLSLVPFSYSVQARYLALNEVTLGLPLTLAILVLGVTSFYIFKASNNEKSAFRQGEKPHLKYIKTERGTNLLVDSWWGVSQHPNYLGDWLYSLTWCLSTGFGNPINYYYSLYFGSLLLHRQQRDEVKCREKYGKDWEKYEKQVPYKIVPYVY